jgi:hypothetical protein
MHKVNIASCPGNFSMLQLNDTQFLTDLLEITLEQVFVGITACRLNCLSRRGSSCVAYLCPPPLDNRLLFTH